jgi:nicotinamidase-related amidase
MRILIENTIAVVIDLQSRLIPSISDNQGLIDNTIKLITGLKALDIPIIVTEQYSRGLGSTINSIKEVLSELYLPIEKMSFSCCDNELFMSKLNNSFKNIIVFGIEAHVCVLQTTIDLIEKKLQPIVIQDCMSSRNPNDKLIALERMKSEGAIISGYESILFELLRYSSNATFKIISKIVK